ncbi:hypothetical protein GGTG_14043 [Gaeumannomyces tritici R3-111a-1]|uniref:Uncharacterized protein n=1 Tax=Gaeumannomyces tritici (strain R3-111a-1) TaxID=644352 RepID=J3PKI8_GAET3|nr:hypothetical protein GGTG_14043 [Gaeumannomyces tritici R3-111a-1]EJT68380.1 hypothetical protein GGTG_14043 [Gaeumannomyces tritici R3-111a-1]
MDWAGRSFSTLSSQLQGPGPPYDNPNPFGPVPGACVSHASNRSSTSSPDRPLKQGRRHSDPDSRIQNPELRTQIVYAVAASPASLARF